MEENTQITLRDTIAEQFDALEEAQPSPAPEPSPSPAPSQEGAVAPELEAKPGRTANRLRDDAGRLLPGTKEIQQQAPETATTGTAPAQAPGALMTPAAEPIARPSSWKKEMWEHWDKLPPDVAKYVLQRESEFAKGVSTYKQEWENSRPVMEALAPHLPLLQQHGIDPGQQVSRYMTIHKTLALGSPQEKLGLLKSIATDYKIPLEQLFVQGEDGKVYINNQVQGWQPPVQQPDVKQTVQQILAEERAQNEAQTFISAKDASGNPLHPHFEVVRATMSQILAAGLAPDLPSAYEAALKLPQHAELYAQDQQQAQAKDEAEKAKKLQEQAQLARRNAVSVRSATPASKTGQAAKGLRATLEQAFDEHSQGRV